MFFFKLFYTCRCTVCGVVGGLEFVDQFYVRDFSTQSRWKRSML